MNGTRIEINMEEGEIAFESGNSKVTHSQEEIRVISPSATVRNTSSTNKTDSRNEKPDRQTFSFRADTGKIREWKLYAEAINADDIGILWSNAIDEYIVNHPMTSGQKTVYYLKKQAEEVLSNHRFT